MATKFRQRYDIVFTIDLNDTWMDGVGATMTFEVYGFNLDDALKNARAELMKTVKSPKGWFCSLAKDLKYEDTAKRLG